MSKFIKKIKMIIKLETFLKSQEKSVVLDKSKQIIKFIIEFFTKKKYEKEINSFAKELVRKYYWDSLKIQCIIEKDRNSSHIENENEANEISELLGLDEPHDEKNEKRIIENNDDTIEELEYSREVKDFYLNTIDLLPKTLLDSLKNLIKKIYNWIELSKKWPDSFEDYFELDIKSTDKNYKEKILDFYNGFYVDVIK